MGHLRHFADAQIGGPFFGVAALAVLRCVGGRGEGNAVVGIRAKLLHETTDPRRFALGDDAADPFDVTWPRPRPRFAADNGLVNPRQVAKLDRPEKWLQ